MVDEWVLGGDVVQVCQYESTANRKIFQMLISTSLNGAVLPRILLCVLQTVQDVVVVLGEDVVVVLGVHYPWMTFPLNCRYF